MFFVVFLFSGTAERIFMKLLPNDTGENGVCNVVPPPGEWRMLMICVIGAITRGRHARRLGYKIMSARDGFNLVHFILTAEKCERLP